jgi:hypothetical protein
MRIYQQKIRESYLKIIIKTIRGIPPFRIKKGRQKQKKKKYNEIKS